MKLISWNVNGLRAAVTKGFMDSFNELDADIFCLQETKLQPHQIELELPGYEQFWNSAVKKGYSGTAVFTRVKPMVLAVKSMIKRAALLLLNTIISISFAAIRQIANVN